MKKICVFAGSNSGTNPLYQEQAAELGKAFAREGIELVYGGATSGLMGVIADTILEHGGHVTGIMPSVLAHQEASHQGLTELIEVDTMHERKAKMSELSDGYIALPGGFGTLEELFEALSWAQIGLHTKPIGLFNVAGYYTPFINMVEHAVEAGFVQQANLSLFLPVEDPDQLLREMNAYHRE
ncbi:TIGR00730 family Rossman fold protein [Thalassobacillus sp. CUG 92003]|uniref:LOG family protein n=1 Tax=Thalassobacillus sp. CUG 92003 TaxID=2736641 RepID=UPI0015E76EF3|nr:TIGR00730 family Rossman fold protein [Thalassobacillus sp. CUG 92003]